MFLTSPHSITWLVSARHYTSIPLWPWALHSPESAHQIPSRTGVDAHVRELCSLVKQKWKGATESYRRSIYLLDEWETMDLPPCPPCPLKLRRKTITERKLHRKT